LSAAKHCRTTIAGHPYSKTEDDSYSKNEINGQLLFVFCPAAVEPCIEQTNCCSRELWGESIIQEYDKSAKNDYWLIFAGQKIMVTFKRQHLCL